MSYANNGYEADTKDQNSNVKGGVEAVVTSAMTDSELRAEKRRMMKNVILISFSFMLLFTAFQSMANLQSSINKVSSRGPKFD